MHRILEFDESHRLTVADVDRPYAACAFGLLEAIRDYFFATGIRIGMKPAGGIRTAKESLAYLVMLAETLGDDWLTPDLFRFGASSLLTNVLMQIARLTDGRYQSADYFSLP